MIALDILDSITINRDAPTPLYHQVSEALLTMIKEGKLREGDLIPTEREIGEKFQVSRITVRRAIAELVRDGYLLTQQGKGTFVARPKIMRHMGQMKSFSQQMSEEGYRPGSRLLSLRHEKAGDEIGLALNVEEEAWIWVVERLRLADEEAICLSKSYLNIPASVTLTPAELEQQVSLWAILAEKGIELARSETTIQAVPATEQEARLLKVEVGEPLLLVEGTVYSHQSQPIEYYQMWNRADRYKYTVSAVR